MFVHERQHAILDQLRREPRLSAEELRQNLNVSRSTLRRDLLELEERGELLRVHGGVLHPDHVRGEPSVEARRAQALPEKRAIAAEAAGLIVGAATVFLDAGTTCLELGRLLSLRDDVRIYTNSIPLLAECGGHAASMTCVGGEYRHAGQATVGPLALTWLGKLRFDVAFIAASGLDADGPSTTEMLEASVKRAAMDRARSSTLLADLSKWDEPAELCFAEWGRFDRWVVDAKPGQSVKGKLKKFGVEIIAASHPST